MVIVRTMWVTEKAPEEWTASWHCYYHNAHWKFSISLNHSDLSYVIISWYKFCIKYGFISVLLCSFLHGPNSILDLGMVPAQQIMENGFHSTSSVWQRHFSTKSIFLSQTNSINHHNCDYQLS